MESFLGAPGTKRDKDAAFLYFQAPVRRLAEKNGAFGRYV